MGRRGNQTFLKNQKAQKRVARANAKRAEKQARRDDKVARASSGDVGSGPPIEWNESGEPMDAERMSATDGTTDSDGERGESSPAAADAAPSAKP
jgi:hypothetical protein